MITSPLDNLYYITNRLDCQEDNKNFLWESFKGFPPLSKKPIPARKEQIYTQEVKTIKRKKTETTVE